jgi:Polyketide cyclase / dehydrase and lipid transport
MVSFREAVTISAAVPEVARVLCEVEGWPSWHPAVTRVVRHGSGPLAVGERVDLKQPRLPASRWTVTTVDASGFAWESSSPGVRSTGEHWAVDAGGGRTEVTLTLALSGPLARPLGWIYGRLIRRYVRLEAESLRSEVEGGANRGTRS